MTHPCRRRMSTAEAAEAVNLARAGVAYEDIAARLGFTVSAVQRRASRAGIRRSSTRPLPTTSMLRAYEQGTTAIEIARQLGVANSTVLKVLRLYGAKIRQGGNTPRLPSSEIIRLRERHGLTFRQIGERFGLTAVTVGTRYRRAKRRASPFVNGRETSCPST